MGDAKTVEKGKTAVVVVDVQRDFAQLADGALAVEGTDQDFIHSVRLSTEKLKEAGLPIIATQDWHPSQHVSFFTNHKGQKAFDVIRIQGREQILWPPHCVQGTEGAALLLDERLFDAIVRKGTRIEFDSYSGFQDEGGYDTSLHRILQQRGITETLIYGIATDRCVRATVVDAVDRGYHVRVIKNLTRGVDPDTSRKALAEMESRGVIVLETFDLDSI